MLLELADEADATEGNTDFTAPDSCIPGSDGEISDERQKDPLSALAEEIDAAEPAPKKKKVSVPGKPLSAKRTCLAVLNTRLLKDIVGLGSMSLAQDQ